MAHSVTQTMAQLSFAFEGQPAALSRPRGWSYLLADSVAFSKEMTHAIRIQKPEEEKVPEWICKLITSGQCKTIYVENLHVIDAQKALIQKLCQRHAVAVVNLHVTNDATQPGAKNVVTGPW